ncbi:hypothetical protein VE01_09489 [Pseudogymnoascus verrucosus]|uniref:MHD domain-containing protein n=1 Tax=Pseudogymnoascus verrucosus TaxID=342668 RepID=A0A1B8G9K2_9PEZI|nr:uncharacterized protein VE01_09489 [Pseudogymnoascus verrucosus]OBT92505.1 hypothetical protein VE01_09489 [Pseudogymnoascus verrucosus]
MEGLVRQEYPGMLVSLPPSQAVHIFSERVKRVGKLNAEIADWLQERRKVEDLYVQGLKKLARRPLPDTASELGIFNAPWSQIVAWVDETATSHAILAKGIEKDVEQALRQFPTKNKEMGSVLTIQGHLAQMAKEYESAQDTVDKLAKKGSKANQAKTQQATQKLNSVTSEWESQAPFIFEKLQAIDETRLNHLRDVLTQFETHEMDQVERNRVSTEAALTSLLEVDTAVEIHNFATNATQGKPKLERRATAARTGSTVSASSANLALPPPRMPTEDSSSLHSARNDASSEHKKESTLKRFGTIMNRRRQSIHAGSFGRSSSPSKGFSALGAPPRSRDGRPAPSPRASSSNLRDNTRQNSSLGAVAESPATSPRTSRLPPPVQPVPADGESRPDDTTRDTNGGSAGDGSLIDSAIPQPPPQVDGASSNAAQLDEEGFTVPPAANDAISQAQREANSENEATPAFKLNIAQQAIQEEDADAQAALSNVANTLRTANLPAPSRKVGTVRGRRDVRNSMYVPGPEVSVSEAQRSPGAASFSAPPAASQGIGRAANLAASASDLGSSADSIRSATSAGGGHIKHPEMTRPGLNSSIIETVNLLSENGEIKTVTTIGEIALSYVHPVSVKEIPDTAAIRLFNFAGLEAIAPNKAFLNESSLAGEYSVQLSEIKRTNCAFKYKVHTEPHNLYAQVPLLIKPMWKSQGDKLGVVVDYSLNEAYSSEPLTLSNLTLIVSYEGAKAISAQTRPSGTHVKEKSLVFWRLGDVLLEPGVTNKVLGRLLGDQGGHVLPGVVEAKWEIAVPAETVVGSGIGVSWKTGVAEEIEGKGKGPENAEPDPFADEDAAKGADSGEANGWTKIESVRKVTSGKYDAITGADQA